MSNKLLVAVLIVAVLSLATTVMVLNRTSDLGVNAGTEHYFAETFHDTLTVDTSGGLVIGDDGTEVDHLTCDTATWDPGSVSSSTDPQSLAIANGTGAALGDVAWASFDSATSTAQWEVSAKVTAAASGSAEASTTIFMVGIDGQAAVDISTSTAKVCTIQF